ncbi:hypothetical protein QVD17_31433 [Tagetes erecta]|uniref:Secreted protein n=1 Tax=Tagetes erecta TaxID=13708 RepID=A0AAD8K4A6_TARER|nr:hypothetical protein QVD17_31433 [Tagetes erecta]
MFMKSRFWVARLRWLLSDGLRVTFANTLHIYRKCKRTQIVSTSTRFFIRVTFHIPKPPNLDSRRKTLSLKFSQEVFS